jgi:hypothetical protein
MFHYLHYSVVLVALTYDEINSRYQQASENFDRLPSAPTPLLFNHISAEQINFGNNGNISG